MDEDPSLRIMSEVPNATPAREVRAGGTIRFAVGSPTGLRSSTWRIWSAKHTKDVYLAARSIAGLQKVSLHESRAGRTPSYQTRERSPSSRRARPVTWTSGQHLQASARAGVGATASSCRPPTCDLGRGPNQVISRCAAPRHRSLGLHRSGLRRGGHHHPPGLRRDAPHREHVPGRWE